MIVDELPNGDGMVSVLASSMVDRGFVLLSGQTKENTI